MQRGRRKDVAMGSCEQKACAKEEIALRVGMMERSSPYGACASTYGNFGWDVGLGDNKVV